MSSSPKFRQREQTGRLLNLVKVATGLLFLGVALSELGGSSSMLTGEDEKALSAAAAQKQDEAVPPPVRHAIPLKGLQTPEMHTKMMQSCPAGRRLKTDRLMDFPKFIDKVFDGLEKVPVDQDPLNYVASQYSKLMEERGALGSGSWTEFGVWQGGTLKKTHQLLQKTKFTGPMAGFDSFEGLPENWRGGFVKGRFSTAFEKVRANVPEAVSLYEGWFQNTIGKFLEDFPETPAGLINHDGDLFVSTAITFSLLGERIVPGTLMCFDELIGYAGYQSHEILSLFIWMKEMEATLCPIASFNLDRQHAQNNTMGKDVGQAAQSACFQVLDVPGSKTPVPVQSTSVGAGSVRVSRN